MIVYDYEQSGKLIIIRAYGCGANVHFFSFFAEVILACMDNTEPEIS